jgi:GNAT superfamily N-acetyltransferase
VLVDDVPVLVEVRFLTATDPAPMAEAFAAVGWPGKTADQYRRYLEEQADGTRAVLIATVAGQFAGYLTVCWTSSYRPFRAAGVPEIVDLNVLPHLRRRRVASTLMDEAERLVAAMSDIVGIGVGLYADYVAAHLLYLGRGYLPDGRGIAYRGNPVDPGTSVPVDDDLVLMMTRRLL